MARPFKIYYAVLPSSQITNCVAPGYRHVTGENTPAGIAERLRVQNPYIKNLNQKNQFYIKLEESVLKDGFVNPILIQAGYCLLIYKKYLPEEHRKDISKALCCDRNGGSRLWVAQKHNLDIPCIISDFSEMFKNKGLEELYTDDDIRGKYGVNPKRIIINGHGVHVGQPVHIHLENENKWGHGTNKNTVSPT